MNEPTGLTFENDSSEESGPLIGMAPLVDIVLLLISFYLLVMQSIQNNADPNIMLPHAINEKLSDRTPAELVINFSEQGVINFNGLIVNHKKLHALLSIERQKADDTGMRLRLVVRADARQLFSELDELLENCRQAGFAAVTLRTKKGAGP